MVDMVQDLISDVFGIEGYESIPKIIMSFGDFHFSTEKTGYNEIQREIEWYWNAQSRLGNRDKLQYTGKGARTVTLSGEVHASMNNGPDELEKLVRTGDEAKPQPIVSGRGDLMGFWVLVSFSDTGTRIGLGGGARYKTFTGVFKYYGERLHNP